MPAWTPWVNNWVPIMIGIMPACIAGPAMLIAIESIGPSIPISSVGAPVTASGAPVAAVAPACAVSVDSNSPMSWPILPAVSPTVSPMPGRLNGTSPLSSCSRSWHSSRISVNRE
ncbi:hypothetical protein C1Y40_05070 [Mycobacterium talmoniae]|uniref:Uncharacterized protein n=1 Tax=Mycobacterium talmoniae TaxID=1858794 RepID=A0A2S8BDR0_9MYCO|nr:hypothetical protein C1Y40_05070 [Mycobacterium talmoniae]